MKKNGIYVAMIALGLSCGFTACSSEDDPVVVDPDVEQPTSSADLLYTQTNASSWGNYMRVVANLLKEDAATLYADWNSSYNGGESYATLFKGHNNATFPSAISCVEQLIDGCWDIANEVGTAKIGDPYNLYMEGKTTEALYAVESWYSWHSREDYRNNIYSIRNVYYGSRDGQISDKSLSKAIAALNPELDETMKRVIAEAAEAIWDIPSPFRSHINSQATTVAMEACAALADALNNQLKPFVIANLSEDAVLDPIVTNYVDVVVLPTYADLKRENANLADAVAAFAESPSDAAFEKACQAWLDAREPWETSEAFLFGPVADKGLDPNMDSWPLDQDGIVQLLNSGNYAEMEWSGDYDEESDAIAAAQSLRGYHTLEFLLFRNGEPRSVAEGEK